MSFELLLASSDSGVATAWLLSTLGSRSTYKKISKKDVLKTSIPSTCSIIKKSDISLRFSSNLMFGIALLYRQKVDYYFNDVINAKTKIQRDLLFRGLKGRGGDASEVAPLDARDGYSFERKALSMRKDDFIYLVDDPLFNVNFDLLKAFQYGEDGEIGESRSSQGMDFDRMLIMDKDLDHPVVDTIFRFDETVVVGEEVSLDFEFDGDGMVAERNRVSEDVLKDIRDDLNDFNLDERSERSISERIEEELKELTNKPSGIFKATGESSSKGKEGPKGLKKRVIVDLETTIPENEFKRFRKSMEEDSWGTTHSAKIFRRYAGAPSNLSEFIAEEMNKSPSFIRLCYLHSFGKLENLTDSIPSEYFQRHSLSIQNEEVEFSRKMAAEEVESSRRLEISRSVAGAELNDGSNISDLELSFEEPNLTHVEGYEDDDTFDLSFPDVQVSSNWSGDEEEGDELGSNSSESGIGSKTIIKFYNFLKSRSVQFGLLDKIENGESVFQIDFEKLIPTESVSRRIAAASFSSVLFLATTGAVQLNVSTDKFVITSRVRDEAQA